MCGPNISATLFGLLVLYSCSRGTNKNNNKLTTKKQTNKKQKVKKNARKQAY
jgi:hypothetical protein